MGEVSVGSVNVNVNGARDVRKRVMLYELFEQKKNRCFSSRNSQ